MNSSIFRARWRTAIGWTSALLLATVGCVHTPSVSGVAGTAPSPDKPWTPPPAKKRAAEAPPPPPAAEVPADIAERIAKLTLTDIVDLALRNNPATRLSWSNARSAAAAYGSTKGAYFPTIDGNVGVTRIKTLSAQGRSAVEQTTYGPSLQLSWLLLDFGGRSGSIDAARQALLAADWTHNATIQNVVLDVEQAYFQYVATRSLLDAQRTTYQEALRNLEAAEERHRVGLATVGDVLLARTSASQARLDMETTEGALQTTRGALALSVGLPANTPYDISPPDTTFPVEGLVDSVGALIDRALESRPDLAASAADVQQARARVKQLRSERLPALTMTGNANRTYLRTLPSGGNSYTVNFGLSIPLFAGFSRAYDQVQAEAQAEAAAARHDALQQQVVFEVYSSYYALQTAARRVRTAADLLASAQQSEEVALGRYRAGVGTVLDLLSAQSALASARAQQVQARWIWQSALAQLAHDTGVLDSGGGTPFDLAPDSTRN
ncbi:MAG TPA: TolC family protein [Gemmatimonadaceae bacterium]|nr:TolC family protein [Gemmatimonadaceae bacterium]